MNPSNDKRIVMTLDAGGTNFNFSAIRGNTVIAGPVAMPSDGDNLDKCLENIVEGFTQIRDRCPELPAAISFAFPGPADYPNGIIGDLGNLPGFRGGIALGPMLRDLFGVPVFINNDGDLFAYGEAIAGFLPHVNGLLEQSGSPKRYRNLLGITLGTGFGGGIVLDGKLMSGDNSISGEVWLLRNRLNPKMNAEEGCSIRAVRRVYAENAGIEFDAAPDPKDIHDIGLGKKPGDQGAAIEAFRRLGVVAGDAIANALTLVDGLAVIGGGIAAAWQLFLPALVDEMNDYYSDFNANRFRRLASTVFDLQNPAQINAFLKGNVREITVPGGDKKVTYDALQRVGVGLTRLGTSEAVSIGAYAYALNRLGQM
ncbi:MAG: ROK family protein [Acidobacteria bacterium]|nr:ROK family protein [Acidobacteriota bacterium]